MDTQERRYTLKASTTPLPSHKDEPASGPQQAGHAPKVRLQNEDDDLYDPYSDFHDGTLRELEFERDPWN